MCRNFAHRPLSNGDGGPIGRREARVSEISSGHVSVQGSFTGSLSLSLCLSLSRSLSLNTHTDTYTIYIISVCVYIYIYKETKGGGIQQGLGVKV